MSKLHEFFDIKQELDKIGADLEFMRFALFWNGLVIHSQLVDFTTTKRPEKYQKKIKRQVQKDFGDNWKVYWKNVIKKGWKQQDRMVLQKGLFKMEPLPPNPPNRPRNYPLWSAVYDLRNYMIKITGKPKMSLIQKFLISERLWDSLSSLSKEWCRRKNWFKGSGYRIPIDDLLIFYEANRQRIVEALRTRVPIYDRVFDRKGTIPDEKDLSKPKVRRSKKEDRNEKIISDNELVDSDADYFIRVIAQEDLEVNGEHYKKGQDFFVIPNKFDKETMKDLGPLFRLPRWWTSLGVR